MVNEEKFKQPDSKERALKVSTDHSMTSKRGGGRGSSNHNLGGRGAIEAEAEEEEEYEHWSMLMEKFLRLKEYWQVIEYGVETPDNIMTLSNVQQHELQGMKLKDLKAKNYLFQAIDRSILETILNKATSKVIWDSMKKKYQGSTRARRQQLQALRSEFDTIRMKPDEPVSEGVTVVEKILRSLTTKFNFVVCAIEESKDVNKLSLEELQS
nr:hypothetical protein [Tanacetum cinerariifolium]